MDLDFENNYLTNEKNVKIFLKSLSDEKIKNFYEAIEYTPFPVLLTKEYKRRFSKNKSRIKNRRL